MSSYVEVWLKCDSMKSVDYDIDASGLQAPVTVAAACAIIPMGRA